MRYTLLVNPILNWLNGGPVLLQDSYVYDSKSMGKNIMVKFLENRTIDIKSGNPSVTKGSDMKTKACRGSVLVGIIRNN
jgi:hypothetical protein